MRKKVRGIWIKIKSRLTAKFWLEQVLDIVIAVLIALCFAGVISWKIAAAAVIIYVTVYIVWKTVHIWSEEKAKFSNSGGNHGKK